MFNIKKEELTYKDRELFEQFLRSITYSYEDCHLLHNISSGYTLLHLGIRFEYVVNTLMIPNSIVKDIDDLYKEYISTIDNITKEDEEALELWFKCNKVVDRSYISYYDIWLDILAINKVVMLELDNDVYMVSIYNNDVVVFKSNGIIVYTITKDTENIPTKFKDLSRVKILTVNNKTYKLKEL